MEPIKVAEGSYTTYFFECYYFKVYLADSPNDVAKIEGIGKEFIHAAGSFPPLKCNIYLVHSKGGNNGI